jgi:hypothetical protein
MVIKVIKNTAGIRFIILCFYKEKYEKGKEQLLQAVAKVSRERYVNSTF